VCEPLLQAFPFPSTLGKVTLHQLSQACVFMYSSHGKWVSPLSCGVFFPPPLLQAFLLLIARNVPLLLSSPAGLFIYSSCGKWVFPPLLWSFPPTATFTSFPTPGCWACAPAPVLSSWLVYLQFREGLTLPPFGSQGTPPSLICVFFVFITYYSVFFSFFPQWGLFCLGGYADLAQGCLCEYHMPLSSPCGLCLPKQSGHWHLVAAREPSWFPKFISFQI
jgi:hypothetical protein